MKSSCPLTPEADLTACSTWRVLFSGVMQRITARLSGTADTKGTVPTFSEWLIVHLMHRVPAPLFDVSGRIRSRFRRYRVRKTSGSP